MFENETTFILGAGASWHYGYPTGIELIKEVKKFAFEQSTIPMSAEQKHKRPNFSEYDFSWAPKGGNNNHYWDLYSKKMEELYKKINTLNPLVIDYFLKENEDVADAGRYAIAYILLRCERSFTKYKYNFNSLKFKCESDKRSAIEYFQEEDDWYRFLLDKIIRDCHHIDDLCSKNRINIITFNYDISLEARLYESLSRIKMFENQYERIKEFIESIIFHVYGSLRDDFTSLNEEEDIFKSASEIAHRLRLVHPKIELKDNCEQFYANLAEKLKSSERIFFLGFGFDKNNSDLIGVFKIFTSGTKIQNINFINFENHNRINKLISDLLPCKEDTSVRKIIYENAGGVFSLILSFKNPNGGIEKKFTFWVEKSIRSVYEALEKDFVL